jgi:hypothetical protein
MTSTPRFVLPGNWGRVNLSSESASRQSIRKIAETATGRKEELASVRAELRERFQKAADVAREGGASDLYVAFSLTKGIPLPAWLTVFEPEIDSTDFDALGIAELKKTLDLGITTSDEGVTSKTSDIEGTPIHAIRQSWRRQNHVVEGEIEQTFEFLEADYWLAAPNPNRIALLTFSTALAEYEEEMLGLFDAVIQTIRWPAPDPS